MMKIQASYIPAKHLCIAQTIAIKFLMSPNHEISKLLLSHRGIILDNRTSIPIKRDKMTSNEFLVYDMYVIDESGIPVAAGCTGTSYCTEHFDKHPLHTGFINAIQSFGHELFSDNLNNMEFNGVNLSFRYNDQFTMVAVHKKEDDLGLFNKKMDDLWNIFLENYTPRVKLFQSNEELFDEFRDDMVKLGLIPGDYFVSTLQLQEKTEGTDKKQPTIIQRIRSIFRK